jgi:hypothetical protein
MKKNWFIAILAGLIVAAGGTAIASIPSGSGTSFNVQDPAVTVIASGQNSATDDPECTWAANELKYCYVSSLAFTPAVSGVCQVNLQEALYGFKTGTLETGTGAGYLNVGYGIAERVEGTDTKASDENGVGSTPNYHSEQSLSRSRLIPIEAGKTYAFEPWIKSYGSTTGRSYWDLTYVCYGA